MTDTLTAQPPRISTPATPSPSEADLVKRINEHLTFIEKATREIVPHAINVGGLLLQVKANPAYGAYGKWGP